MTKEADLLERVQDTLHKAEQNVAKTFADLMTLMADTQAEAKKRVDDLLNQLPTKVEHPLGDAKAKVQALRHDFELRLGEGTEVLWERLGLATKADLHDVSKKLSALAKRLTALESTKKPARSRQDA